MDSGEENLIKALDNCYLLKDRDYSAYKVHETFEKLKCLLSMAINNYIIELECFYHKINNYDMAFPDGVLAYKFLNNAFISKVSKDHIK